MAETRTGFINATQMCLREGKLVEDWMATRDCEEGVVREEGTWWVNPIYAISLKEWLVPGSHEKMISALERDCLDELDEELTALLEAYTRWFLSLSLDLIE